MAHGEIIIKHELRPCIINGKEKALFHCWEHQAEPIPPGLTVGSHPGGQFSRVCGLVELEDGHVMRTHPGTIRFIDRLHSEYIWDEPEA